MGGLMSRPSRREMVAMMAGTAAVSASPSRADDPSSAPYLFTYFTDRDQAAGLSLAWSNDGLTFEALRDGAAFLKPAVGEGGLMRDPCLFRGPGGNAPYHLVWTTAWKGQTIGHATSPDLIHWSPQQAIPVMKDFPATRHAWAPEGIWDPTRRCFVLFWSSTVTGMFSEAAGTSEDGLNPRIFYTTTRDFRSFTPTGLLFDPGYQVIDASFMQSPSGALFLLFKDERLDPLKKDIRIAAARSATGAFVVNPTPISGSWVEGPTGIWTGFEYRVYADSYREKHMTMFRSHDLVEWLETPVSMPTGMKHGTIVLVSPELIGALRR